METDPFVDDSPMKIAVYEGLSTAISNNQMVTIQNMWHPILATHLMVDLSIEACPTGWSKQCFNQCSEEIILTYFTVPNWPLVLTERTILVGNYLRNYSQNSPDRLRYPLFICCIAIENGPVEILSFPIHKMVEIFHSYVNVDQRVLYPLCSMA